MSIFGASNSIGENHDDTEPTLVVKDEIYHLLIIASNFEYLLVDVNLQENLIEEGYNEAQANSMASYNQSLYNLDYGRGILIEAKSAEGTHGLLIDELSIDFTLIAPQPGENFGEIQSRFSNLPSVDSTIDVHCNVFCGAGHSEMNIQLNVGEGFEFEGNSIDFLTDWRVWLLFGFFGFAVALIVMISVMKPRFIFTEGQND